MNFVRKVANNVGRRPKKVRGILGKYKNKELRKIENTAWAKAMVDKYENR